MNEHKFSLRFISIKAAAFLASIFLAFAVLVLSPTGAFAMSYQPGQTLNPACTPQDPTCVVVASSTSNTAANFIATSSSATSTFAGNVAVSGNVSIGSLSGILKAIGGVIQTALVNLSSDVTGILGITNGGTGTSTAPALGQILIGNGSGGYSLIATSSLGIAGSQWTTGSSNIYYTTGNVGIGTTSPSQALSVNGNLFVSGTAAATQPASTDNSNTLVSSGWVDQFFPGLTTNSWLGTPGLKFTNCSSQSTCGWTLQQTIASSSQSNFTTFGSFRNETYVGGTATPYGVNGNFYTTTSPYGATWDRVVNAILHNTTLATENAQNVAVSGYAYRQMQTGTSTSYEPGDTWGGNFVCNDTTGLPNPTRNCTGLENDIYVAPGGGTDVNGQRTGVLISAGAISPDLGVHIGFGLKIQAVGSSTIDNGIYFGNCSECSLSGGQPAGFYGNYISDATGNVRLTSSGSLTLNTSTSSPGLTLSGFGAYGSTTLELNKLASGQVNTILGTTGGTSRWGMQLGDATAESGTNLGSNFEIARYSDLGANLGSPFVILRSSGNVGISTTTPDAPLTVQSNQLVVMDFTSAGSQFLTFGRVSGAASGVINSPVGSLFLQTGGLGRNVAIGTTTNPLGRLSVTGADTSATTMGLVINDSNNNSLFSVFDNGSVGIGTSTPGSLFSISNIANFSTATSTFYSSGGINLSGGGCFAVGGNCITTPWTTNGSSVYYNSGNVGIGTTTPDSPLSIQSTLATVMDFTSAGTQFLNFGRVSGAASGVINSSIGNLILQSGGAGRNVGIGTTTPYTKLEVWGSDTASTSPFAVVNSASTTVFAVFDNGNATYSGSIFQSSDQRLKTDILSLDASSSLADIEGLNPVSYIRLDQDTGTNLGFIAQQVQQIFPELVSTTSATALTPNGTLTLNYVGLIAPMVKAIQALGTQLAMLEQTVAGFAQAVTTQVLTATTGHFSNQLCVGSTCVTPAQFQAMVAAAGQSGSSNTSEPAPSASVPAPSADDDATTTAPVIQINGDNPATIKVGDTYNDLGATITGPTADLNLGIQTFVGTTPMSQAVLDTSAPATYHIYYVVTDTNGLTSTSTRTVIVQAAPSQDESDSETAASSTDAAASTTTPTN